MQFLANHWKEALVIAAIDVTFLMPEDPLRCWKLNRTSDSD